MLLDNLNFDLTSNLVPFRTLLISEYGTDMEDLLVLQVSEENITGYSNKPLELIKYWATFSLCAIIKYEVVTTGVSDIEVYDEKYNLITLGLTLQQSKIDITKFYEMFELFGY